MIGARFVAEGHALGTIDVTRLDRGFVITNPEALNPDCNEPYQPLWIVDVRDPAKPKPPAAPTVGAPGQQAGQQPPQVGIPPVPGQPAVPPISPRALRRLPIVST